MKIITSRLIDMDTNNQHELSLCIADEELLLFTLLLLKVEYNLITCQRVSGGVIVG